MNPIRTLHVAALLALTSLLALAAPAQAHHVCYTPGDFQVCTEVPGDELLDPLFTGCVTIGASTYCAEPPALPQVDRYCWTPGSVQVCIWLPVPPQ